MLILVVLYMDVSLRYVKKKLIHENFGEILSKILGKLWQWLPPFGIRDEVTDGRREGEC